MVRGRISAARPQRRGRAFSICLENIAVVCYTAFNDESMSGNETEGFGGGLCGAVKYIPPGAAEKGEKR